MRTKIKVTGEDEAPKTFNTRQLKAGIWVDRTTKSNVTRYAVIHGCCRMVMTVGDDGYQAIYTFSTKDSMADNWKYNLWEKFEGEIQLTLTD